MISIPRRAASVIADISACIIRPNSNRSMTFDFRNPSFSLRRRSITSPTVPIELSGSARPFCLNNMLTMSCNNSRLIRSLASSPKAKSRRSSGPSDQYVPPPYLGTSLHPTVATSPVGLKIAAPTCLERSPDRRDADFASSAEQKWRVHWWRWADTVKGRRVAPATRSRIAGVVA